MVFQNINQFTLAKNALIESECDIKIAFNKIKDNKEFSNLSENEIYAGLENLDEGLGEKIMNFLGGKLGGDISKIKTVLGQMKEHELKFNQEEFEIYNQFYSLIQDQKALDMDKNNPNYKDLSRELLQEKNLLNIRMKELTKTYNEIFNALEKKVESLIGTNNRKKRFFNAQRATDILKTKNDRYEKIKSITNKSAERSNDLNSFFGVDPEQVKKDAEIAKEKANETVKKLESNPIAASKNPSVSFNEEPEKGLQKELYSIMNSPGGYYSKKKQLEKISSDLEDVFQSPAFNSYQQEKKINLHVIYNKANAYLDQLEAEEKKITV